MRSSINGLNNPPVINNITKAEKYYPVSIQETGFFVTLKIKSRAGIWLEIHRAGL